MLVLPHTETLVSHSLGMETMTLKVLELKQLKDQMENLDMVLVTFLVLKVVGTLVLKVEPLREVIKLDIVLEDQDLKVVLMERGLVVVILSLHHHPHRHHRLMVSRH